MRHDVFTLTPTLSLKGRGRAAPALLALLTIIQLGGCIRITINPQCPEEIEVGGTGQLVAQAANTGAIATYKWEAVPAGRVTVAHDNEANTSFEAVRSGQVTFTLTASDGLFQMIDTCTTIITAPGQPEPQPEPDPEPQPNLSVNLIANPARIVVGEDDPSTLLTCTGATPAMLTIDQLDGPPVELTTVASGISVAVFGTELETYTFRCLAMDSDGNRSEPALVRVTVSGGTRPPTR